MEELHLDILEVDLNINIELLIFIEKKKNMSATVERIEYDPNRTAYIALITYKDKEKSYIICPQGLKKVIRLSLVKTLKLKLVIV